MHFVGWGGEKQRLAPGQLWALERIPLLMSICEVWFLFAACIVILVTFWIFFRRRFIGTLGKIPISEGFWRGWLRHGIGRFGRIWKRGFLILGDFEAFFGFGWRIFGRWRGGKRLCVWSQMYLRFR